MNLPNKLTMARILFIPLYIVLLLAAEHDRNAADVAAGVYKVGYIWAAVIIFFIASMTDMMDGHLAVKLKQVTVLGKIMDPVADKLLIVTALIMLVRFRVVPSIMVVIMVIREFMVQGMRIACMSAGRVVPASFWARYKSVAQYIAIITAMVQWIASNKHGWPPGRPAMNPVNFTMVSNYVMGIATLLSIYTGIEYFYNNREIIQAQVVGHGTPKDEDNDQNNL